MAVTAPGPLGSLMRVPMPGLSWVSVHPDHRRRGVLRAMVTHHLADLRDQGAALSGLHAAEVAIYGRFGYAAASAEVELTLARGTAFAAPALRGGRRGGPDPLRRGRLGRDGHRGAGAAPAVCRPRPSAR